MGSKEGGKTQTVQCFQRWPVREAWLAVEKMQGKSALLTCERVIDGLFPVTQGGTAATGEFPCFGLVNGTNAGNLFTGARKAVEVVAGDGFTCVRLDNDNFVCSGEGKVGAQQEGQVNTQVFASASDAWPVIEELERYEHRFSLRSPSI